MCVMFLHLRCWGQGGCLGLSLSLSHMHALQICAASYLLAVLYVWTAVIVRATPTPAHSIKALSCSVRRSKREEGGAARALAYLLAC